MPKRTRKRTVRKSVGRSAPRRVKTMTAAQISATLEKQRQQRKQSRQYKRAKEARDAFKVKAADKGKLILVGTKGQRDPQSKGRKGHLVYVTRTGKKWLIRQTQKVDPYRARKITDIEPPARKNLKRVTETFQKSRRVTISKHISVVKGSGSVKTGGQWDFNDKAADKIAASIRRVIMSQASQRSFLISVNVLLEMPNGQTTVVSFSLPIDKPDHISIKLAGIRNFVRMKFYAFMARELAYLGFVSNGSANHIRSLAANQGKDRGKWIDRRGQAWHGRKMQTAKILTIEWKIEQIK